MKRLALSIILLWLCTTYAFASNIVSQDLHSESSSASYDDIVEKYLSPKKKVAIFLDAPLTYVNNETVRKLVPEKANKLFEGTSIKVIPFDESMLALRTYLEDNRMIMNEYYAQPLNREDLKNICKEIEVDYALFIKITNTAPRFRSDLFAITSTYSTTVNCDVRLLDIGSNKYIISKSIVKDGSTTSLTVLSLPDFSNAYTNALKKALNELSIDKNML